MKGILDVAIDIPRGRGLCGVSAWGDSSGLSGIPSITSVGRALRGVAVKGVWVTCLAWEMSMSRLRGARVALAEAVVALGVNWRVAPKRLLMGDDVRSNVGYAAPRCSANSCTEGGRDGWLRSWRRVSGWLVQARVWAPGSVWAGPKQCVRSLMVVGFSDLVSHDQRKNRHCMEYRCYPRTRWHPSSAAGAVAAFLSAQGS